MNNLVFQTDSGNIKYRILLKQPDSGIKGSAGYPQTVNQ
jgi:hypothetical protein